MWLNGWTMTSSAGATVQWRKGDKRMEWVRKTPGAEVAIHISIHITIHINKHVCI